MKYYWIHIDCITSYDQERIQQPEVSTEHPFLRLKHWLDAIEDSDSYSSMELINWKEISKEEYDLYKAVLEDIT